MLTTPLLRSRTAAAALMLVSAAALGGCAAHRQHAHHAHPAAASASAALDVTTLNGERPPGRLARLVNSTTMLDTIDVNGQRIVVEKGTRKAGTRVGIHVHEYGGHTCVLSGEITGFMEGHAPKKWPAGTCYYMPPNMLMAAANLGTEDVELIDTFILPPGKPTITIREPGFPAQ
jgi:hypothetical protein